jgi:hypothetical protein
VPINQLERKLVEIAGSYKEALARAAPNPNDPPEIAKVKTSVKAALDEGAPARADELLAQLEKQRVRPIFTTFLQLFAFCSIILASLSSSGISRSSKQ